MKTSLSHLPENKQQELSALKDKILEYVPETEMIILYGSYATGKYIEYDQKHEYTYPTYYMSDYDILVLIADDKSENSAERRLYNAADALNKGKHFTQYTPIQFTSDSIKHFMKAVDKHLYFYVDIITQGILLFNSEKYTLPALRELNFSEIAELSEKYFKQKYKGGVLSYAMSKMIQSGNPIALNLLEQEEVLTEQDLLNRSAFLLHQACENFLTGIILTSSLYSPKEHRLNTIINETKRFTMEAISVFPGDTPEEERLFKILVDAYVQGRYNPDFNVTKEELEILTKRIEILRDKMKDFCLSKIQEHRNKIGK